MRHSFHSEQWLPHPLELVFAFFANPENLPRLMPPWQAARIEEAHIAPPPPHPGIAAPRNSIAAGTGTHITLSFKPFPHAPFRIPWEAEISDFTWNDHFCDTQLRGPFAYWHHCHTVISQIESQPSANNSTPIHGTLLRDEVEYELPLGKLGNVAQRLFIAKQLRRTFAYRATRTTELLAEILSSRKQAVNSSRQ
jgi:ligand-binding SRPBCC domain-containing protein